MNLCQEDYDNFPGLRNHMNKKSTVYEWGPSFHSFTFSKRTYFKGYYFRSKVDTIYG